VTSGEQRLSGVNVWPTLVAALAPVGTAIKIAIAETTTSKKRLKTHLPFVEANLLRLGGAVKPHTHPSGTFRNGFQE
jgi:hypothetical protein